MSELQKMIALENEKSELEALINEADADGDIVGRLSFSSRLESVASELENLRKRDTNVAEVAILFDGAPVEATRTIDAKFAADALKYFQGIVTSLFASKLSGEIAQRGKIKGARLASLNIRGVAVGSFGFILEEKDAAQSSVVKTGVRKSIEHATELFDEFTQENEDDFLIDVDHISPRVFKALAKFFNHLEKNEASLKTNLPDRQFNFDRTGIQRAHRRISETHIRIDTAEWTGTLVGLSPIKRTFDFKQDGAENIISGKFGERVSQDYLERIETDEGITLGNRFRADVEIGTIRKPDGTISTSYTMVDLEPAPRKKK